MKIHCICMVKNEAHHAHDILKHFTTLFDQVTIIDHNSDDDTRDILKAWKKKTKKINLYSFSNPGYFQSELMTYFARSQSDADWVFFLDFDEYLPFKNRLEFEQSLVHLQKFPVISMPWHNLIPIEKKENNHLNREYYVTPHASPHTKVAFQPSKLTQYPNFVIEQGNHGILFHKESGRHAAQPAFAVFHIPIDSLEQLKRKISQGQNAYKKMSNDVEEGALGEHWFAMGEMLGSAENPNDMINGFVATYGETETQYNLVKENRLSIPEDVLKECGYRKIKLDLAGYKKRNPKKLKSYKDEFIELRLAGDRIVSEEEQSEPKVPEQTVSKWTESVRFEKLSGPNHNLTGANVDIGAFLVEAARPIETMTPTAWGGHIPFMFALVSTLKPRRFVELGTHCGASFFAACQAINKTKSDSVAIAVDLWAGDPQAGFYGEEVYDTFELLRKARYSEVSRSIRSLFSEATELFDDESVDLIHIDGLHTFAAVKEDYEFWRPKLTPGGVMIFHDTNEYITGFGVWDYFDRIRSEATASFNFKHSHGLGVMAFGNPDENPMIEVVNSFNDDPVLFESYFSSLGEIVIDSALYQFVKHNQQKAADEKPADHMIAEVQQQQFDQRFASLPNGKDIQTAGIRATDLMRDLLIRGQFRISSGVAKVFTKQ